MEENQRALATSFRILSKKAYSKREIEKKLFGFNYSDEAVYYALSELDKLGFLDDDDYASQIVTYYLGRFCGKERIKQELYKRLIDKEIIDEKLCEIEIDYDKIVDFYLQKLKGETKDYKLINKVKSALLRKGFSFDEINLGFSLYKEKLEDEECQ